MSHIYKIICFAHLLYIRGCLHDLFPVVLHAGLPADTEVPRERVQTVLLRAICGSTMSSMIPPTVTYLNNLGLSADLIFPYQVCHTWDIF